MRIVMMAVYLPLFLGLVGCGSDSEDLKKQGKELVGRARDVAKKAEWDKIITHVESKGLAIRELAALYKDKKWDDAKTWVEDLDDESVKIGLRTVGEVLYLEETKGIEKCSNTIDKMMSEEDINPARKKTLSVMKSYVNGKGGLRTSDIVITVAVVALACNGVDMNIHSTDGTGRLALILLAAIQERTQQKETSIENSGVIAIPAQAPVTQQNEVK